MLTAEAQVQTDRPSRYLQQLCRHASRMGRHLPRRSYDHDDGPPEVQRVEWSNTYGTVRTSWGRWSVRADPDLLTLRAEAADVENLRRIQALVAGRLEKIGRRDRLLVTWQPPEGGADG